MTIIHPRTAAVGALLVILGLVACGGSSDEPSADDAPSTDIETVLTKVG